MRSPLFQLLHSGQIGTIDDLADAAIRTRQREASQAQRGHVQAWVNRDPAAAGAYTVSIVTPVAVAQVDFDPDSDAARLLHSAGVTHITAKPVATFIPLDIAAKLIGLADGRAA